MTLICPASPEHGRTVYQGHLFVGDRLLSESSMAHHPLTPMTDPNLVRVLGRQTAGPVGLLRSTRPGRRGGGRARLADLRASAPGTWWSTPTDAEDLAMLAEAPGRSRRPHRRRRAGPRRRCARALPPATAEWTSRDGLPSGPGIVLAGSCSAATLQQVALARSRSPPIGWTRRPPGRAGPARGGDGVAAENAAADPCSCTPPRRRRTGRRHGGDGPADGRDPRAHARGARPRGGRARRAPRRGRRGRDLRRGGAKRWASSPWWSAARRTPECRGASPPTRRRSPCCSSPATSARRTSWSGPWTERRP